MYNRQVIWLYGRYLGQKELLPIEVKYQRARAVLKEKFEKVYNADKFEESWDEIAKELNVDINPRLNSNQVKKDYRQIIKFSDLSRDFKLWHEGYNKYDYLLYQEFCT